MAKTQVDDVKNFTRRQLKKISRLGFDWNMMIILMFLLIFGLIMVYSASSYVALRDFHDQAYFFKRQLGVNIIGLVAMIAVIFIPISVYRKKNVFIWVEYLVATFIPFLTIPFGTESHGASRWVQIPGLPFGFQPAEVSKLLIILFMAGWLYGIGNKINDLKIFLITMLMPVPSCAMYYVITRNLSSAIIIYVIAFAMIFVASKDYKKFLLLAALAVVIVTIIVLVVSKQSPSDDSSFRIGRIYAWLHPEATSDTTSHQTIQALYAIGNGGIWGKGLGQSVQKISNLPEPHNDMIFAVICEELGIIGALALIVMFGLLLWRLFSIAKDTEDKYSFLVTVGVFTHIAVQVVLNIAVATNSIPNTGVSLPFISYGGTSALFLLIEMGLVFAVNRKNIIEAKK